MNLIKCKVCGERHRLDQPHVALTATEPERRVHPKLDDESLGHHGPKPRDRIEAAKAALAEPTKFDKTAYQREYMRRKRAEKGK